MKSKKQETPVKNRRLDRYADKAAARGQVGTRTNQGSRIDYITEKPYLHHQLGVPRGPILTY